MRYPRGRGWRSSDGMRRHPCARITRIKPLELLVDPGHLVAHLLADALDRVVLALFAHAGEVLAAGAVLGNPLAGELARLDLTEDLLHRRAGLLADHALAARHVAVLGGVGDRVAHPLDPLLVHQVGDQLELVEALEVGEARVVTGLYQRLEASPHQLAGAAAEDGLLAEEVGLALVLEARLDDRRAAAADRRGVGEDEAVGGAGRVLAYASAIEIGRAHV